MRFANINRQEIGMVFVIVINLNDVANLAAEGRSSKAAKNEHERPGPRAFANMKMIHTIECHKPGIWGIIPHFQISPVHVRQGVPHHSNSILRTSSHVAEHPECRNRQHAHDTRNPNEKLLQLSALTPGRL
jgi:hypothetical protein